MTRILVTGGAGYIGSHTCKLIAAGGMEPIAYDNLVHGHRRAVRWGPLVVGDILDRPRLVDAFREYRPDAVIHFAAFTCVRESFANPAKYYWNNVAGTLSLLEAMRSEGVHTIVFSSSCAIYGTPQRLPITEDMPQRPLNPYGRTKLIVEQTLADYAAAYGFRYAALRYFNACGLDPDGELGEDHDPETHLIPRALMAAAGHIPHLEVFGDDYPTWDGTCIRDYIHVMDLAEAHIAALDQLRQQRTEIKVNIGTGQGLTILQVLDSIERVTGRRVPTIMKERRPGDPPELCADCSLAAEQLGFRATRSSIDRIVSTAWPHFSQAAAQC